MTCADGKGVMRVISDIGNWAQKALVTAQSSVVQKFSGTVKIRMDNTRVLRIFENSGSSPKPNIQLFFTLRTAMKYLQTILS
jgi:hypothetical protein